MLSAFALAQYPVGPNTGFQTTSFSNSYFSAVFNGAVEAAAGQRNSANTSTTYVYSSSNANVSQSVLVRIVDQNIAVDTTSSDFYANSDNTGGEIRTTSHDVWEGHPFTYTFRVFTSGGVEYSRRTRIIVVNSREVIFISQTVLNTYDDQNEWLDFEYSLRIK